MADYGQDGVALGADQQHDAGQDVHVDITGGEHEQHAGAYHQHQQQVPAHGDDAAYAAMNADLMAPKACRWAFAFVLKTKYFKNICMNCKTRNNCTSRYKYQQS